MGTLVEVVGSVAPVGYVVDITARRGSDVPMTNSSPNIATWLDSHRVELKPVPDAAIVGIGHVLTHCQSVLGRLKHEARSHAGASLTPVRSILFVGPPGSGKTLVSRWFGSRLGPVPAYDLPTEQLDPERIRTAFAYLGTQPRSIVFLPEIDAIALGRRDSDRGTRARLFALLEALDGLSPLDPSCGPVVIATTNAGLFELDRAAIRPGRLGTHVVFGLPTREERLTLFRHFALPWAGANSIDWNRLAELTRGWSPADVRGAVEDAVGLALVRSDGNAVIADEDLLAATRRAGRVESETEVPYIDPKVVAIHEAGHVAVALVKGIHVASVTLGLGHRSGQTRTGEENAAATAEGLSAGAVVAMGGFAAEELLCGVATAGSTGDVHDATQMLITRIEAGLDAQFPPISRRAWGGSWGPPKAIDELIAPRVMELLGAARDEAREIVSLHRDAIAALAESILAEPVLTGDELAFALAKAGLSVTRAPASQQGQQL